MVETGKIVHWNPRGFGFIVPDGCMRGEDDVFVHATGVAGEQKWLDVGQHVEFRRVEGLKGEKAVDVRVI